MFPQMVISCQAPAAQWGLELWMEQNTWIQAALKWFCMDFNRVPTGNPFQNSPSLPLVFPDIETLFKYVC